MQSVPLLPGQPKVKRETGETPVRSRHCDWGALRNVHRAQSLAEEGWEGCGAC